MSVDRSTAGFVYAQRVVKRVRQINFRGYSAIHGTGEPVHIIYGTYNTVKFPFAKG